MKRNLLSLLVLFVMIMLALGSMDSTDVVTLPSEQSTELQPKATKTPSPTTSEDSKTTRKDSPAPRKTSQLIVEDWRFTRANTFVTAAGRVTNNTASALKNVMAVVTFVTADGEFVKTSEALISYNPVLPGQTSPFEAITSDNPEIAKASISFKFLLGGTLSSTTREEVNKPTPEELAAQRKAEEAQRKAEESEMAARRQAQQEADRVRKEKEDLVAAKIEAAKWRTWMTADENYKIRAKYIKLLAGKLTIEKEDGTTIDVDFDLLRKEDQEFVKYRKWKKIANDQ